MVGRTHPAEAPQRGNRDADALTRRMPRTAFNQYGDALPDPNQDLGAFLYECDKRMTAAANKFAAIEQRIRELDRIHTYGQNGDPVLGHISLGKDGEMHLRASNRDSARQRVRTYAALIEAKVALLNAGVITLNK